MSGLKQLVFLAAYLLAIAPFAVSAQDATQQEMRSLDDQVQEVKSDVLSIARDLSLLEERLLYPSNTELAVFVDLDGGESFRLDAIRLEIDDEPVASYIYSFKELEALQQGGVQRLYTGNVTTGSHQLTVQVDGKLQNGKDFSNIQTFPFSKSVEPDLLGIELSPQAGGASIALGDW